MKTSAKVAIGVTLALFAAAGFIAYRVHSIMHATVSPTHDYPAQVVAMSRHSVKQWSPQADYAHYSALLQDFADAHDRLLPARESSNFATFTMTDAVDPAASPEDRDLALTILASHEQAGRFTTLAELPSLVGVTRTTPAGEPLALRTYLETGAARSVARVLHVRAMMQFRDGQTSEALASIEQLLALSVITGSQPTMIDYLIGASVHARACDVIRRDCATQVLDVDTSRALVALLEKYACPSVQDVHIEAERLILHDVVQWTYTDEGNGNGRLAPQALRVFDKSQPGLGASTANPFAAMFFADRKSVEERIDAYCNAAREQAAKPMRDRDPTQFTSIIQNLGRDQLLLGIMAPPLKQLLAAEAQMLQVDRGVRVLLAIEAFEAQHGHVPDSLEQLVPQFMHEITPDEWASDGKWVYRVPALPRDDGRTFLLYSIGIDQVDQGGAEATPDVAALNIADHRADFVVNMPPKAMPKFD